MDKSFSKARPEINQGMFASPSSLQTVYKTIKDYIAIAMVIMRICA